MYFFLLLLLLLLFLSIGVRTNSVVFRIILHYDILSSRTGRRRPLINSSACRSRLMCTESICSMSRWLTCRPPDDYDDDERYRYDCAAGTNRPRCGHARARCFDGSKAETRNNPAQRIEFRGRKRGGEGRIK